MRLATILVLVGVLIPTVGISSDPGEPLDCSDWVFLEPGLYCEEVSPFTNSVPEPAAMRGGEYSVIDNVGRILRVERVFMSADEFCDGIVNAKTFYRTQIVANVSGADAVLAHIDDRCGALAGEADLIWPWTNVNEGRGSILFDRGLGALHLLTTNQCRGHASDNCESVAFYGGGPTWFRIRGFATTFEILQTYTPTSGPISFRVPYMPEGFPAADWFDTYYGELATVGDWSQAQPLECGYPTAISAAGDFLAVADPLPDPDPGEGRYYVTAATYQGQRRYGRKAMGGVLSGRDPVLLPTCSN